MKRNTFAPILIMALLLLVVFLLIVTNQRVNRLERQVAIETAKTNFTLSHFDGQNTIFNRVDVKNDTVFFYKNDSFVGKTITVTQ